MIFRRLPQPGERVKVHVNLHLGLLSVTDPGTGLILAHVSDITLNDVTFHVQPRCLEAARRKKQRQVCAYAAGITAAVGSEPDVSAWHRVTFHPDRADTFTFHRRLDAGTLTEAGAPARLAARVAFRDKAGWVPPGHRHLGDGRIGPEPEPDLLSLLR
jgi:hypothetical protein